MVDKCLRFYAVDLRKYGRSLLPGQKPFEVRDMTEYFADIDSALAVMKRDGVDKVVLVGHSTGGLTSSLYMAEHPDTVVKALVLNSPFLDWNLGRIEEFAVPAVAATGKLFPGMPVKQGDSTHMPKVCSIRVMANGISTLIGSSCVRPMSRPDGSGYRQCAAPAEIGAA